AGMAAAGRVQDRELNGNYRDQPTEPGRRMQMGRYRRSADAFVSGGRDSGARYGAGNSGVVRWLAHVRRNCRRVEAAVFRRRSEAHSQRGDRISPATARQADRGLLMLANPLALIAEVTHRCPLHCVYCSNPLELAAITSELKTEDWKRVFAEAAQMGV